MGLSRLLPRIGYTCDDRASRSFVASCLIGSWQVFLRAVIIYWYVLIDNEIGRLSFPKLSVKRSNTIVLKIRTRATLVSFSNIFHTIFHNVFNAEVALPFGR